MFTLSNDVADLDRESRTPILRSYLDPNHRQSLIDRQPEVDQALQAYAEVAAPQGRAQIDWVEASRRLFTLYDLRLRFRVDRGSVEAPDYNLLRRVLETARNEVSAWGGELVFVFLPSQLALRSSAPGQAEARDIVRALGLQLIDVTAAFAAHPDPPHLFQAREGTHYSADGHALVAATVIAALGG